MFFTFSKVFNLLSMCARFQVNRSSLSEKKNRYVVILPIPLCPKKKKRYVVILPIPIRVNDHEIKIRRLEKWLNRALYFCFFQYLKLFGLSYQRILNTS